MPGEIEQRQGLVGEREQLVVRADRDARARKIVADLH
jgi:hypothetical protein